MKIRSWCVASVAIRIKSSIRCSCGIMKKWAFQRVKCLRYDFLQLVYDLVDENVMHTILGYVKTVVNCLFWFWFLFLFSTVEFWVWRLTISLCFCFSCFLVSGFLFASNISVYPDYLGWNLWPLKPIHAINIAAWCHGNNSVLVGVMEFNENGRFPGYIIRTVFSMEIW